MSVWPLVDKLRILQGSVYNLFGFMKLDRAPFIYLFFEGLWLLSRGV